MGRRSNSEKLRETHKRLMREFDRAYESQWADRKLSIRDREFCFLAGSQWSEQDSRQFENRPKVEINKVNLSVTRIYNEYRNSRVTVDFVPKPGADERNADVCDGLYRADEQDSFAQEAYDNAFEEAVSGGRGAWRYRAIYDDEEEEDETRQRIAIEPIFEADRNVWWGVESRRQDKSDAKRCWVITGLTREAYEEEYGEEAPASFPTMDSGSSFAWTTPDLVYIAEAYEIEKVKETVRVFLDVLGETEEEHAQSEFEADPDLEDFLAATGWREVRQVDRKRRKVHKYIIDGQRVIEDQGYIAGKHIPIVQVFGKRLFFRGAEHAMGHARHAVDPQRIKNMQVSAMLEAANRSAVSKPVLDQEEIEGFYEEWRTDNVNQYPLLRKNTLRDLSGNPIVKPLEYTQPPAVAPAMAALLQITETDLQDILGRQQEGEALLSNQSGKAVELVQQRLDMLPFIYTSNFAKGLRRGGEIWLSMARELYVEQGRTMRSIGKANDAEMIELKKPMKDRKSGEVYLHADLSKASFDVVSDVGPSSSSAKAAAVRALVDLMQVVPDPETQSLLGWSAVQNVEGEGIADVKKYARKKLLAMGIVEPTEEEAQEMQAAAAAQQQTPDPQAILMMSAAQQAEAEAAKARADTVLTVAKASESRAKTEQIQVDTQIAQAEAGLAARRQAFDEFRGATEIAQQNRQPLSGN